MSTSASTPSTARRAYRSLTPDPASNPPTCHTSSTPSGAAATADPPSEPASVSRLSASSSPHAAAPPPPNRHPATAPPSPSSSRSTHLMGPVPADASPRPPGTDRDPERDHGGAVR